MRRWFVLPYVLAFGVVICAAACGSSKPHIVAKARAVSPRPVQVGAPTAADVAKLTTELARDHYKVGDHTGIQIALWALDALKKRQLYDAAFFLTLADHRMDQIALFLQDWKISAEERLMVADGGLGIAALQPYRTEDSLPMKGLLVIRNAELEALFDRTLQWQAEWLGASLHAGWWDFGINQLAPTPSVKLVDRWRWKNFTEILAETHQKRAEVPGKLTNPGLLRPFTDQLARTALKRVEGKPHWLAKRSISRLAKSPFKQMQQRALLIAPEACDGRLIRGLARNVESRKSIVVAALHDGRPFSRSNAAMTLGVGGDASFVPELEAALEDEKDLRTILSIKFALSRYGRAEYIQELLRVLDHDDNDIQDHAGCLLSWYPQDVTTTFDDDQLVQVFSSIGYPAATRYFAGKILDSIARQRPLSEEALVGIMEAVKSTVKGLAQQARDIVASTQQLSRPKVRGIARSNPDLPLLRAALQRLSQIAEPGDEHVFIDALEDTKNDTHIMLATIQAMGRIPGEKAKDWLLDAFEDHRAYKWELAGQLAARSDLTDGEKDDLSERLDYYDKDRLTVFFKLVFNFPDANEALAEMLETDNVAYRGRATMWAYTFGVQEMDALLWSLIKTPDNHLYPKIESPRHNALKNFIRRELEKLANERSN